MSLPENYKVINRATNVSVLKCRKEQIAPDFSGTMLGNFSLWLFKEILFIGWR